MKRFVRWFWVLAAAWAAVAWPACQENPKANLIVIHSGRLMGNVFPLSAHGMAPLQYYPYLAGYLKKVRAEAAERGQHVLVIDSGDALSGSFASAATDSANVIDLLKALEYDAVVLGNLDANLEPEVVGRLAPIPVLTPFTNPDGTPAMPGTSPVAMLEKGPHRIRLVANFYGNTDPAEFPTRFPAYFAGNARQKVEPVRDYQALLADPGGSLPHLTLLNWFKFEAPEQPPEWIRGLAAQGIDAVLAHRIYQKEVKETWGAGDYPDWPVPVSENILRNNRGFAIARLDLRVVPGEKPKVVRRELIQLTADTAAPDPEVVRQIEKYAPVLAAADRPVGRVTEELSRQDILRHYLNSLTLLPHADAVVYSIQSVRGDWPPGELKFSRLYETLPWDTANVMLTLTPQQFAELDEDLSFAVAARKARPPGEPVHVATSTFFGAVLRDRFGLAPDAIQRIGTGTETQAFADYLQSLGDIGKPSVPEGWEILRLDE